MNKYLKITPQDNVVVALADIKAGDTLTVEGTDIVINNDIVTGHKIAIADIDTDADIFKYGAAIGHALSPIKTGDHVHVHNIKTNLSGTLEYKYVPKFNKVETAPRDLYFDGYKRKNGEIGIRNELWIIPTVGCVNGIAQNILDEFKSRVKPRNIDHMQVYSHNYGCSQLGEDHAHTVTILSNMVKHPNAGGVLVLGLGCENNQIGPFKETLGEWDDDRVKFLITQDVEDEIEAGVKLLEEIYSTMENDKREPAHISNLKVGLECGGSDGFSGITANPMLGVFSDTLIASGGTSVLTEVPEMFGAETILMERCKDEATFDKTVKLINGFKAYFEKHNQPIYENPSPGNKNGGITSLEDKSLGCTMKGGMANVQDVYEYGEWIKEKGLVLLCAPGNDMVATTALGASGCQMVLFTTGRGTPYGGFIPTIKVSTNSALATKKPHWIDFNAGKLVEGVSMETLSEEFTQYVIEVASGKPVNHEKNNFRNIAIWKSGVTL